MTDKKMYILAELYSRPNATNGKYKACKLGLENLTEYKDKDISFLKTLQIKADFADKTIAEAESKGEDTTDPKVLKELGETINARYFPINKSESIMTAIFVSFRLIISCGIAIGIWGVVFKKSFLVFGLYGVIMGLFISLLCTPIIAKQRTRQRIRDTVVGVDFMFWHLIIFIAVVGLLALGMRLIFFYVF